MASRSTFALRATVDKCAPLLALVLAVGAQPRYETPRYHYEANRIDRLMSHYQADSMEGHSPPFVSPQDANDSAGP